MKVLISTVKNKAKIEKTEENVAKNISIMNKNAILTFFLSSFLSFYSFQVIYLIFAVAFSFSIGNFVQ